MKKLLEQRLAYARHAMEKRDLWLASKRVAKQNHHLSSKIYVRQKNKGNQPASREEKKKFKKFF